MDERRYAAWAGLSVIGGFIVGIAGFFAGILSLFNEYNYVGVGLCFLASAFAFGLLANALFRK
jgi:F0F1-type ATP synthase membrane subunit c/vacuolar-type H+-ATPase subunit K